MATEFPLKRIHGFSLFGDLKYAESFTHYGYANPDAPKGGTLRLMGFGTFDTLNPYTLKGISPINSPGMFMYGFSEATDTLLVGTGDYAPSGDEPQAAYGLVAESISYPDNLQWARFHLRPEARFSDQHPIRADDVIFSYHLLLEKGHPRYRQLLSGIQSVEAIDHLTVEVHFKQSDSRADLLRFGELPVLPKHYWQDRKFEKTSLDIPITSSPYRITRVEGGRSITLTRVPDYWAKDLPVNKGRYNFDEVIIDFYRDQTVAFEAFKKGEIDIYYDYTAKNWATAYNFPALINGKVIKKAIPHEIPSGTQGFFFNTRRALFQDARVRQALGLLFDFEWTNKNLFHDAYRRSQSYYPNSSHSATGLPSEAELAILGPFRSQLPKDIFTQPIQFPTTQGDGNVRAQMRQALALLSKAGWKLNNGTLNHPEYGAFSFEILIRQPGIARVVEPWIRNLEKIGIRAEARLVDTTQYKTRLDQFDFDVTTFVLSQGLTPGHEQKDYYHSAAANIQGSQNYAGIQHPVIDHLVEQIPRAENRQQLTALVKALDRVLLSQHYIVPNWHLDYHRIAYKHHFRAPTTPPYKLGVENWWISPDSQGPNEQKP